MTVTNRTLTRAAQRTTRRAARSVQRGTRATGRAIARTAPPVARALWVAVQAVAVFLLVWAPRGLWKAVSGWARLVFTVAEGTRYDRAFYGIIAKAGCSGCLGVLGVGVLVWAGAVATAMISAQVGYDHGGTIAGWVAVTILAGVWAVFGIIGRPAVPVAGPALPSSDQKAVANVLRVTVPAVRADAKDDQPALMVGPLERQYDREGRSIGKRMRINLPPGALFEQLNPVAIAQALGKSRDQITLQEGTHPGQVLVHVADVSIRDMPKPRWDLADARSFDLVRPLTIGVDNRGQAVTVRMFGTDERGRMTGGSMLLAGATGSGKTSLLRMLVGAAALDPRAVIAIYDGKGDGDFASLAPALDWHREGDTPTHRDDLRAMLGQATDHMNAVFAGTADRVPVVIVIDEAHDVLGSNGGDKDLAVRVEHLVRKCRAAGMYLVVATQRATKTDLPTGLSKNLRDRVCLRVTSQDSARVVLEWVDGSTPNDDPSKFSTDDVGLAVVDMHGHRGRVKLTEVTSAAAGKAARVHPRVTGQLFGAVEQAATAAPETPRAPFPAYPSGPSPQAPTAAPVPRQAMDPDPEPRPLTIRDHLLMVWPEDQDRATTPAMLGMLLSIAPAVYAGWEPEQVTTALKAAGWTGKASVWIDGKSRRGAYRADIEAAQGGV